MNFEYFFAKRITFSHQRPISRLIVRLAVISIALAVATIEISLSVVQGFETEIQRKVTGFSAHIQLGNYYRSADTEISPIPKDDPSIQEVKQLEYVSSISPYVERNALFKSKIGWEGVLLKGVDSSYHWGFFETVMKAGIIPGFDADTISREVVISQKIADRMDLNVGDKATMVFFPPPIRRRPVLVAGIYETSMEEFDNQVVICDMRMLQKIWRWQTNQVSAFEVKLHSLDMLDPATEKINEITPYLFGAEPITHIFPEIFDWLRLQHQNVRLILVLMIIIGIINMITVLLILILERTRTVGILKAMGLPNFRVQRMFVWNSFFLILIGMLVGNLLGLGLLASQDHWGWLRVNQADYFIETVPVAWVWFRFLMGNLLILGCSMIYMVLPTILVTSISPLKALRFE